MWILIGFDQFSLMFIPAPSASRQEHQEFKDIAAKVEERTGHLKTKEAIMISC